MARTSTSSRSVAGPSFRVMVTGPSASDQVRVKLWPAVTAKSLLVNWTARAEGRAATMARKPEVNFILLVGLWWLRD